VYCTTLWRRDVCMNLLYLEITKKRKL